MVDTSESSEMEIDVVNSSDEEEEEEDIDGVEGVFDFDINGNPVLVPANMFKGTLSQSKCLGKGTNKGGCPPVFLNRSHHYAYIYRDFVVCGQEAISLDLDISPVMDIFTKALNFSPIPKKHLEYARQHLYTILGDSYTSGDGTQTETSEEEEQERVPPSCFQPVSLEHNSASCRNGKIPEIGSFLHSPVKPVDMSVQQRIETPASSEARVSPSSQPIVKNAIAIVEDDSFLASGGDVPPRPLKTNMPYSFERKSDPDNPTLLGVYTFVDKPGNRNLCLSLHKKKPSVSFISLSFSKLCLAVHVNYFFIKPLFF